MFRRQLSLTALTSCLLLLVLVCLGCYNKIPWVVLLVRETVLEAEIKALADSVSGEDPLPHRHIFHYNVTWWKEPGNSEGLFCKVANPIHEGTVLMTKSSQRLSLQIPSHSG